MIEAVDLMRNFVSNLKLPLTVWHVDDLGNGEQTLFVENTQYLNTKMKFMLNGEERTVKSFVFNREITISGGSAVTVGEYLLDPPYFVHGKYLDVNQELAKNRNHREWNPLVWMLELHTRTIDSAGDSRIYSRGDARLFIMSSSDWGNFNTQDHYAEVIRPMSNIVTALRKQYRRNVKVSVIDTFTTINHAKFSTGGGSITGQEGLKKVLPDEQSGIELTMSLPITKDNCIINQ